MWLEFILWDAILHSRYFNSKSENSTPPALPASTYGSFGRFRGYVMSDANLHVVYNGYFANSYVQTRFLQPETQMVCVEQSALQRSVETLEIIFMSIKENVQLFRRCAMKV